MSHFSPFQRFHFSLFSGVFICRRCFYFLPFSSVFICRFAQLFHLSPFSGVFVLLYRECYRFECFCVAVPRVLQVWESFFTLRSFLPYNPFRHLAQPILSRLPWEMTVLPWRLLGLPLKFKTQTRPIFLFESHSVQQKVLVGRFYLCVKPYGTLYQSLPGFEPTI